MLTGGTICQVCTEPQLIETADDPGPLGAEHVGHHLTQVEGLIRWPCPKRLRELLRAWLAST